MNQICIKADSLKMEGEDEINAYLQELEREVQMQEIEAHEKELKFIEINRRNEVSLLFAKKVKAEGEEFHWNSYDAENSIGPATEFNDQHNFEETALEENDFASGDNVSQLQNVEKRGFPLSRSNSEKNVLRNHQLLIEEALDHREEVTTTVVETKTREEIVTEVRYLAPTTITQTSSITRYIKTSITTSTETLQPYEDTTTATETHILLKTKTMGKIFTETLVLSPIVTSSYNITITTPTSSANISSVVFYSTSTIRAPKETSSIGSDADSGRTREGEQDEALVEQIPDRRTRNGYYHQKALAQKNMKARIYKRTYTSGGMKLNPPMVNTALSVFGMVAVMLVSGVFLLGQDEVEVVGVSDDDQSSPNTGSTEYHDCLDH